MRGAQVWNINNGHTNVPYTYLDSFVGSYLQKVVKVNGFAVIFDGI